MEYIYTITSEDDLLNSCFENLRRYKVIDSTVYYLADGADIYYGIKGSNTELRQNNKYFDLLNNYVSSIDSIIGLGCGNSLREKVLMEKLKQKGIVNDEFSYIGVDTSMTMLNLSMENFRDIQCNHQLVCADLSDQELRGYLVDTLDKNKTNIFTFLGATMGNLGIEYSIDLLSDITTPGDYLIFDIRVRRALDIYEDRRLYEYYRDNYVRAEDNQKSIFNGLKRFGIDQSCGDIGLDLVQNQSISSLEARLKFYADKSKTIAYKNRKMHLMPGDDFILKTYIAVMPDGLINYLSSRGFNLVNNIEENDFGYFLFQKQ